MNTTEWVAEKGITAEVVKDNGMQVDDSGWEHHAYVVRLRYGKRTMNTPWKQGIGISSTPSNRPDEIIDSLVSDSWSLQDAHGFEDWANEFGYDVDDPDQRRAAKRIYNGVSALATKFIRFIGGADELEFVATEVERL